MYVYSLVFLCCSVLILGPTEARLRRTRRSACEFGTYQHEGNTCCLCPRGLRVLTHCTDKSETQCEICEDNTFLENPNSEDKCHPCKVCASAANMETKKRCSRSFNTVCRCKENYYCEKGDHCQICQLCDKCGEHGVKQQCTESNNTVCSNPKPTGPIVAVFVCLILLVLLAGVGVFYLRRKKKLCFEEKQITEEDLHLNGMPADLDLNPHLSEIADVLGWKTMKRVAQRSGMTKTNIEEHELNHRNDVKEQTFSLLDAWSQKEGLRGAYPALIKTLHHINERRKADEIQKIIKKKNAAID